MNLSERGAIEIVSHEAIVLTPYYDSVGVLTWGVGHTAGAGEPLPAKMWGKEYTAADALRVFQKDVERYAAQVRIAFTRPLTQAQFDAAVSFHFNTGAIGRATWVKKFNAGDMAGAKKSFMDWRKPAEIIPRRQKERDLFFDGKYTGNGVVSVYPADKSGKVLWSQGKRVDLLSMLASQPSQSKPVVSNETKTVEANKPPVPSNGIATFIAGAFLVVGAGVAFAWNAVVELTCGVLPWC